MDTTYSRQNRPLTPPNEHLKDNAAPLAPGAGAGITSFPSNEETNPFISKKETLDSDQDLSLSPLLSNKNNDFDGATNDIQGNTKADDILSSNLFERDTPTPRKYSGSQRNETTYRIEREVLDILQWKDPVRSGAIFAISVGSIILTRWYSLLQMTATGLTLATAVNLLYVNFVVHSKRVLTNTEASHPYQ
jgi:hypothetical protein